MASLSGTRDKVTFRKLMKSAAGAAVGHLPAPFAFPVSIIWDYRQKFGRYPNIFFPKTFNEKIQVRKIFDRRPLLTTWADKYSVRDYVKGKLGEIALPALYHVTTDPSDIPFDRLPKKYVVKATHGSGQIWIVRDGERVNRQDLIDRCKQWLACKYWKVGREWVYKDIIPRIIVEELLETGSGMEPNDYKLFVFGGCVKFIQVDIDRHTNHKRNYYDADWKRLDCSSEYDNYEAEIAKPGQLSRMIRYAQVLSDRIDFVRVDLYEVRDRVFFGELTLTPGSGYCWFTPSSWDETLGGFWKLRWWP